MRAALRPRGASPHRPRRLRRETLRAYPVRVRARHDTAVRSVPSGQAPSICSPLSCVILRDTGFIEAHRLAGQGDFICIILLPKTAWIADEDDFDLGGGRMLITKTGDFVKGMSGSPVFGFWPGGPFVVGVVSAGGSGLGNFNAIAGGANLPRLVAKARADLP